MAKVPSPTSGISPALGPTVFQNLQSSPDAFGAAQGRALQSVGTVAQQFGNQIFKEQLKKANVALCNPISLRAASCSLADFTFPISCA